MPALSQISSVKSRPPAQVEINGQRRQAVVVACRKRHPQIAGVGSIVAPQDLVVQAGMNGLQPLVQAIQEELTPATGIASLRRSPSNPPVPLCRPRRWR